MRGLVWTGPDGQGAAQATFPLQPQSVFTCTQTPPGMNAQSASLAQIGGRGPPLQVMAPSQKHSPLILVTQPHCVPLLQTGP
jgi:hypothetical protein